MAGAVTMYCRQQGYLSPRWISYKIPGPQTNCKGSCASSFSVTRGVVLGLDSCILDTVEKLPCSPLRFTSVLLSLTLVKLMLPCSLRSWKKLFLKCWIVSLSLRVLVVGVENMRKFVFSLLSLRKCWTRFLLSQTSIRNSFVKKVCWWML